MATRPGARIEFKYWLSRLLALRLQRNSLLQALSANLTRLQREFVSLAVLVREVWFKGQGSQHA